MAYPTDKPTLKSDFTNTTSVQNTHPDEHNAVATNLTGVMNTLGDNTEAASGTPNTTVRNKFSALGSTEKVVGVSATQTLTNKTLTSPTVNTPTITTPTITGGIKPSVPNTLTIPDTTDTLVGRNTTDTLTNKTLTTPTIASFANANHNHENGAGGGQLNASNVFSSGTVPTARLGSGTANNITFLRGDQQWVSLSTSQIVSSAYTTRFNTATPVPVEINSSGIIEKSIASVANNARFIGFVSNTASNDTFPAVVTATSGAVSTSTQSFAFGAANNRMIVVITTGSSGSVSNVTFGGTTLTQLGTVNDGSISIFYHYAVLGNSGSTDTRTVTVTNSYGGTYQFQILGFKNIDQSTPFDVNGSNSGFSATSGSVTVSPTVASTYALFTMRTNSSPSSPTFNDGLTSTYNIGNGYIAVGEWGATGSNAFDFTWSGSRDYVAFIAFLRGQTTTATITVSGIVPGFSGLTPGSLYYVSNTLGQVSTSAGSTSIVCGKALSATEMVIVQSNP
jgi:hypothetical protein